MSEHIMTAEEAASMLKGQMNAAPFAATGGVDDERLHLSEEDIQWWRDAKLGLFIHWGIYSLIGKGEWAYHNEKMSEAEYRSIAEKQFKPAAGAEEIVNGWLNLATDCSMQYAVMVTRHHDGFALWDSKSSYRGFTSMELGPKTDYVKAFTEGCRQRGLGVGLYYSPMDWRFPGYFDPLGKPESAAAMKQQAYAQLQELCTRYGKVDIIWYDGGWLAHKGNDADAAWFWEPVKLNKKLRSLQPKVMFTPRSGYIGDFLCDEGPHEVKGGVVSLPWEKCMSVSSAWGYRPDDFCHPVESLIKTLVNTVCRDGNLLLNIGPDPQGRIPPKVYAAIHKLGDWLKTNGESIFSTRGGVWQPLEGVYGATYKDRLIYLHVLDCEKMEKITLPPMGIPIQKATVISGEEVLFCQNDEGLRLQIPPGVKEEKRLDTILKLYL